VRFVTLLFLFHDQPRCKVDAPDGRLFLSIHHAGDRQGRFGEDQRPDQGSHGRVQGHRPVGLYLNVLAGGQRCLGLS